MTAPTSLRRLLASVSLLAASLSVTAKAADWPQFRGPTANTVVEGDGYPTQIVAGEGEIWRAEQPGPGSSSPIVLGDAIYVTCEIDGQDGLICYALADGAEQWRRTFGAAREGRHRNATGANPSPVTDGKRIYAYYKSGALVAVDLAGEEVWRRNLQKDFGPDTLWWDLGSSPVLTEAGVFIAVIQADESYLATFDRESGKTLWKVERQFECARESDQAYTTPNVVGQGEEQYVLVYGADHLTGHDPQTGATLFTQGDYNPRNEPMWRVIGSPTVSGEIAVASHGRGELLTAVRVSRTGSEALWTHQGGADCPSPVIHDGRVYQISDKGSLDCLDLQTGEVLWKGRLPRSRSNYYATPLLAGDLLYCFREEGRGHVVRVTDGLQVVGDIDLGDDSVVTPIPIGDGRLLMRTRTTLTLYGAN